MARCLFIFFSLSMFSGPFGLNEVQRASLEESYDIILKLTFRLFSKCNLVIFVANKTNSILYCCRRNFYFMILIRPQPGLAAISLITFRKNRLALNF